MGIPIFFKVISTRYPTIMSLLQEIPSEEILRRSLNPTSNPNGWFDSNYKPVGDSVAEILAIDLNGVVHPVCHPEDRPAPKTEELMMLAIFDMIDRMVACVKPTKILYLALDGVAPRAKMNQQRARRFASASESKGTSQWDSNVITPGTEFQEKIGNHLRWYASTRLSAPGWPKDLQIIISDSSVPGEGEHKIIDFVRQQRQQEGYNPETKTIIAGLDADLILLSLATHEQSIKILRDEQFLQQKQCFKCGSFKHKTEECNHNGPVHRNFEILDVWMLRKCLEAELILKNRFDSERKDNKKDRSPKKKNKKQKDISKNNTSSSSSSSSENKKDVSSAEYDMFGEEEEEKEKTEVNSSAVVEDNDDDNSSLPAVSSASGRSNHDDDSDLDSIVSNSSKDNGDELEIIEETDDLEHRINDFIFLMCLVGNDFIPHLPNLELREGALDFIFMVYPKLVQKWNGGYLTNHVDGHGLVHKARFADVLNHLGITERFIFHYRHKTEEKRMKMMEIEKKKYGNKNEAQAIYIPPIQSLDVADDGVENWKEGWKDRYYRKVLQNNIDKLPILCQEWINAMLFTLNYYYHGCPSWGWYFPFHYSPAASDIAVYLLNDRTSNEWICFNDIKYPLSEPLRPIEQLMSVLPPSSSSALPNACAELMTKKNSPLSRFYPNQFTRDANGQPSNRKYLWTIILPFIDINLLKDQIYKVESTFNENEKKRSINNTNPLLFVSSSSHAGILCGNSTKNEAETSSDPTIVTLNQKDDGLYGSSSDILALLDTEVPPSKNCDPLPGKGDKIGYVTKFIFPSRVAHSAMRIPGTSRNLSRKLKRKQPRRIVFSKIDYDLLFKLGNDPATGSQYPAPKIKVKAKDSSKNKNNQPKKKTENRSEKKSEKKPILKSNQKEKRSLPNTSKSASQIPQKTQKGFKIKKGYKAAIPSTSKKSNQQQEIPPKRIHDAKTNNKLSRKPNQNNEMVIILTPVANQKQKQHQQQFELKSNNHASVRGRKSNATQHQNNQVNSRKSNKKIDQEQRSVEQQRPKARTNETRPKTNSSFKESSTHAGGQVILTRSPSVASQQPILFRKLLINNFIAHSNKLTIPKQNQGPLEPRIEKNRSNKNTKISTEGTTSRQSAPSKKGNQNKNHSSKQPRVKIVEDVDRPPSKEEIDESRKIFAETMPEYSKKQKNRNKNKSNMNTTSAASQSKSTLFQTFQHTPKKLTGEGKSKRLEAVPIKLVGQHNNPKPQKLNQAKKEYASQKSPPKKREIINNNTVIVLENRGSSSNEERKEKKRRPRASSN